MEQDNMGYPIQPITIGTTGIVSVNPAPDPDNDMASLAADMISQVSDVTLESLAAKVIGLESGLAELIMIADAVKKIMALLESHFPGKV